MKKRQVLTFALVVCMGFLVGCSTMSNSVPGTGVPLAELTTTATYDVLGPTQGTSSGGTLFWFIPIGGEKKSGSIAMAGAIRTPFQMMAPVKAAALYNAIEAKPGADALLAPRWEIVTKNYFIYSDMTATVKGKAIRINQSAN